MTAVNHKQLLYSSLVCQFTPNRLEKQRTWQKRNKPFTNISSDLLEGVDGMLIVVYEHR